MKWLHYGVFGKAWIWLKWKAVPRYSENASRLIRLWRTAGEEGNGIWSDGGYWGEMQANLNSASQGEEKGSVRVFCFLFLNGGGGWEERAKCILKKNNLRSLSLWLIWLHTVLAGVRGSAAEQSASIWPTPMDSCHSQLQGFQSLHNQSAINWVSGCGRILNVNCCKVLITPIDSPR